MKRHTPLRGSLETHWEWVRRSQDTARKKAQQAPGPAKQPGESRARRLVRKRSGGLCEFAIRDVCIRQATDWCHRNARSQGGLWLASDGIHGCRPCHRATTNTNGHRAECEANGWVLRRHQNPASTPALIRGRFVLLDDEGGYQSADTTTPRGNAA